jgi:uncharacterized protein YecE (DUF72 family)
VRLLAGTSGWSYPPWRGRFYAPGTPSAQFLAAYAARLPAVEVNASSYRMPRPDVLAGWRAQVPPPFRFALKAPRWMTRPARLAAGDGGAGALSGFQQAAAALGPSLGVTLYQLPPEAEPDLPRLEAFLARLPGGPPAALEFKNPAWLGDALFAALAAAGAALCVTDDDEGSTPLVPTASFGYLRLRRADYDDGALADWAARVAAQPWREAFVFFRHEDTARGPALALRLLELGASVEAEQRTR